MIIPFFDGIVSFYKAPVTWILILINIIFGLLFFSDNTTFISKSFQDKYFIDSQVSLYKSYILSHNLDFDLDTVSYANRINDLSPKHKIQFSALAFKDDKFRRFLASESVKADKVATNYILNKYQEIEFDITKSFEFLLGLQTFDWHWISLISYQFMHGGWFHLLSNMIILLIVGSYIENRHSSLKFLLLYLTAGVGAGLFYLLFNANSMTPLVGASGAISGVMSFTCLYYWNKPIRYFWLVGFNRWSYGFIWLPCWIALIFWLMQDLAGLVVSNDRGGVAYTAHIGGHLVGLCCAAYALSINGIKKLADLWQPTALIDPH